MQQCLGQTLASLRPACRTASRPQGAAPAPQPLQRRRQQQRPRPARRAVASAAAAAPGAVVKPASEIKDMEAFLDGLKWDANGLVVAIAQHVDTGEVLMQAFADRAAILETLQTGWAGGRAGGR